MDKRSLRNKRGKHRASRTHELPNQGILGKVASKVKGILSPWFFNVWNSATAEEASCSSEEESIQEHELQPSTTTQSSKRIRLSLHDHSLPSSSNSALHAGPSSESNFSPQTSSRGIKRLRLHEHSIPGCSTNVFNETSREQDYSTQNSPLAIKRQRLRLPDRNPTILSSGTQTWLEAPDRPHLFGQVPSNSAQNSLIENKDSSVILNGDDHSENSEGSASTSGCSSLVSHKDRANCISSILGEREIKSRRDAASQKELSGDISSSRLSLWSTVTSPVPRSIRSPSIMQSSQPGFSLSAFGSKLSQQVDRKVSSPFYQGRTTFGGASASRRMPIAAAPYQVDKPIRNQIKVRSNVPKDNYEGMSSAAKRILQTLEKMSSPVTDAKKIPNTNKSPVDLSLYLMPPKHRKNLQSSTPAGPIRGPPIADISTISKLTTIKNFGQRRYQNTLLDSPTLLSDNTNNTISNLMPQISQTSSASPTLPSGGGKMKRSKLNQHHQSAAKCEILSNVSDMENRMSEYIKAMGETPALPEIPLPITSLPTIVFENSSVTTGNSNQSGKDFLFSYPIEHPVPNSSLSDLAPPLNSFPSPPAITTNKNEPVSKTFVFSNPIQLENPISPVASTFTATQGSSTANQTAMWECSACWVRNPVKNSKCIACETPNSNKKSTQGNPLLSSSSSEVKSSFESVPKKPASTWECSSCWIRNPADKDKCLACEEPNPSKGTSIGTSQVSSNSSSQGLNSSAAKLTTTNSGFKFNVSFNSTKNSGSVFGISSPTDKSASTSSNATVGFKLPDSSVGSEMQNTTFGGFTIPVSKQSSIECKSSSTASEETNKKDVLTRTTAFTNLGKEHIKETVSKSPLSQLSKTVTNSVNHNSEKEKSNSAFSFVSNSPLNSSPGFSAFTKKLVPAVSSSWECDVCLVRNEMDKQKCVACESLKPNKKLSGAIVAPKLATNSPVSTSTPSFQFGIQTTATSISTSSPEVTKSSFLSTLKSNSLNPLLRSTFENKSDNAASQEIKKSTSNSSTTQPTLSKSNDKPAVEGFKLNSASSTSVISTAIAPVFHLSSTISSDTSLWECSSCQSKNDADKQKCGSCNTVRTEKTESGTVATSKPALTGSTPTPTLQFGAQATQPVFGKSTDKPIGFDLNASSSATTNSTSALQFSSPISSNTTTWDCSNCHVKNEASKEKCSSCDTACPGKSLTGFTFKGPNDIKSNAAPIKFGIPAVTSATTSGFAFSTSASQPTGGFVFGVKSEPVTSTSTMFTFGSASASTPKSSVASSESNISSTLAVPFQFGSQSSTGATTPASNFGAVSSTFTFGAKTETVNSLQTTPNSQASLSAFGSAHAQPMFGNTTSTPALGKSATVPINFGMSAATSSAPSADFQFGTTTSSGTSVWECSTCKSKNGGDKEKCMSCNTTRSVGLQFGAQMTRPAFGKSTDKPAHGGFELNTLSSTGTVSTAAASVFQFGSTISSNASTWECSNCHVRNDISKEKCISCNSICPGKSLTGFTFKGSNEIKADASSIKFNLPATTSGSQSSGGFVFGIKNEPATSTSSFFTFGSGNAAAPKSSITGFESNLSAAPVAPFQFGSQNSTGTGASATNFGAGNAFGFGAKTENVNPLQPAVASQAPAPAFGSTPTQPMFGNTSSTPAFGKQAPGGFNFGLPTASNSAPNPVFQFGAAEKKQATSSGFSFGTPTQDASSFQPQFNISTPPSFNFGGASTAGPFQFVASSDNSQTSAAPRKIRKAVRRMK